MKKCRIPSLTVTAEGISRTHLPSKRVTQEWLRCCPDFLIVAIRNKERQCQEKQRKQELLVVEAEGIYFKNWTWSDSNR